MCVVSVTTCQHNKADFELTRLEFVSAVLVPLVGVSVVDDEPSDSAELEGGDGVVVVVGTCIDEVCCCGGVLLGGEVCSC